MLSNLPLRWRLSLLLGAVLTLGLSLGVALLTLHAGARIRDEAEAATRLAQDFVETALAQARGSAGSLGGAGPAAGARAHVPPSKDLPRGRRTAAGARWRQPRAKLVRRAGDAARQRRQDRDDGTAARRAC